MRHMPQLSFFSDFPRRQRNVVRASLGLLVASGSLAGCSFIDDFDKFQAVGQDPSDDGGAGSGDAAGDPPDAAGDASDLDAAADADAPIDSTVFDAKVDSDGSDAPVDAGSTDDASQGTKCGDRVCFDDDPCTTDACNTVTMECTYRLIDGDGDGYSPGVCRADTNHRGGDCNDANPSIHPDAPEVCDAIDNNCDVGGEIDEGLTKLTCYPDEDRDGYPNLDGTAVQACSCAAGRIAVANPQDRTQHDCYDDPDGGEDVHPGQVLSFERGYGRNGVRSFDYDCDGDEQPLYSVLPGGTCVGLLVLCVGASGFEGNVVPACGESGRFSVCAKIDVLCGGSSETRKQLCN